MSKVSVQKGPINPNPKTMKTITPMEQAIQDAVDLRYRHSGQQCTLQTPKKK